MVIVVEQLANRAIREKHGLSFSAGPVIGYTVISGETNLCASSIGSISRTLLGDIAHSLRLKVAMAKILIFK